ncbi:MAG: POTRA domain-containing protein, partial [Candidatus Eisenbacteria bacterium]|nr:POTRA domain-containing protein [Candidatus Eisenbacteria bacterium]
MRVAKSVLPVALVLVAVVWMTVVATADVVSGVEPQGNDYVSRDRILLGFGIRTGDELKPESVREGIRRLHEMGYFSDISVEAESTGEGSVRLIVIVEERPKIALIVITGHDHVSETDIRAALKMEEGAPYEASRLEDSRVAVLHLYESKGFPYAKTTTVIEEVSGNRVNVNIEIEEQLRVVVKEIRFEGNEALDASELQDVMETREDRWWRTDAFFDRGILED